MRKYIVTGGSDLDLYAMGGDAHWYKKYQGGQRFWQARACLKVLAEAKSLREAGRILNEKAWSGTATAIYRRDPGKPGWTLVCAEYS
jgi:hypothetical protein